MNTKLNLSHSRSFCVEMKEMNKFSQLELLLILKFEPSFIPVFHPKLLKNHQCENSFRIQKIQLTNWVCLLIAFSLNLCLLKFADFLAKQIFDGRNEMLCSLHHKDHECKLYQNEYPINEMNVNLD